MSQTRQNLENENAEDAGETLGEPRRRRRRGLEATAPSQPAGNKGTRRGALTGPRLTREDRLLVMLLLEQHEGDLATVRAILEEQYPELPPVNDDMLRYYRRRLSGTVLEKLSDALDQHLERGIYDRGYRIFALGNLARAQLARSAALKQKLRVRDMERITDQSVLAALREIRAVEQAASDNIALLDRLLTTPVTRFGRSVPASPPGPGKPPSGQPLPSPEDEAFKDELANLLVDLQAAREAEAEADAWASEQDQTDIRIDLSDLDRDV
jgi:hypothetical protein